MPITPANLPALSGFTLRPPCPALAPFVQGFWWLKSASGAGLPLQMLHPDGGSGLIFNFAEPLLFDGHSLAPPALVSAPVLTSTRLELGPTVDLLGVRFLPGMGSAFLGMGLNELAGFAPQALPGLDLNALADALAFIATDKQQGLLEHWLLARLGKAPVPKPAVQQLLAAITRHQGQRNLAELMAPIPLSQRQLERQFKQQVGLTAKQFSRIQRVALVRQDLKQGLALLDTALARGFSDQAHFIHDFKAVIGITPGQYLAKARRRDKDQP